VVYTRVIGADRRERRCRYTPALADKTEAAEPWRLEGLRLGGTLMARDLGYQASQTFPRPPTVPTLHLYG
jgi:hypothetical protein